VKQQTGSLPSVLVRQARETMKELEGRLERSSASSDSDFRPLEVRTKVVCAPWQVCCICQDLPYFIWQQVAALVSCLLLLWSVEIAVRVARTSVVATVCLSISHSNIRHHAGGVPERPAGDGRPGSAAAGARARPLHTAARPPLTVFSGP